ncbi:DUF6236 family protein [Pseudochelatococcus sp. G4_1912]|uniref:DUF6236 family protein n=1 Tax=Pseudochelatococcus sp. G4_1912 TaxID=3114288 RepID=UPI0039C646B9
MGEAKRRVAFRGTAPKLIGRGLLFPSLLQPKGLSGLTTTKIPEEELQSGVLYWDKIACPTNNLVHVALPEEELLMREEVLIRPRSIGVGSFDIPQILHLATETQVRSFAMLEKERPGYWCLTAAPPEELAHTSQFEAGRSALVQLVGGLPLPPPGTRMESILEFKLNRRSELEKLRSKLDKLYVTITQSDDKDMAIRVIESEVDQAIADLLKTSREWWKYINLADVKTLVSLGAAAAGQFFGLSTAMGASTSIVGGVGAFISITNGVNAKLKADRSSPYWYAVEVKRKLA